MGGRGREGGRRDKGERGREGGEIRGRERERERKRRNAIIGCITSFLLSLLCDCLYAGILKQRWERVW